MVPQSVGTSTARFLISWWWTAANTRLMSSSGCVSTNGLMRDLAVEHEVERRRVVLGRAAPVADRARVERHQVRQPDFDLVHREADHRQRRAVDEQAVGGELAGGGARALEDEPLGGAQAVLLREGADRGLDRLGVERAGVERQRRAVVRDRLELGVVDVDRDDLGAERARDLHAVAADAAGADDDGEAARRRRRRGARPGTAWSARRRRSRLRPA